MQSTRQTEPFFLSPSSNWKEGAEESRVESVETRAPCKRVKLPEAFELPRKFGVSWGCLTQKAHNGLDAVVAEGGAKGLRFRYVLPYDAETGYYATYKRREEREEKSDRLPQYFADALYELAAKYQIELTRDIYVLVNGAEVDKTVCYQKRSAEACARAIEDYVKNEWPRILEWRKKEEEQRRLELKSQVMAALKDWYRRCFRWPILPGEEGKVVKRLELYYGMCEMAKAAIAEYGEKYAEPLISEYALRRAFWWEGEWRGKPMSCFVTGKKAVCRVGEKMATFLCIRHAAGNVPKARDKAIGRVD